MPRRGRLEIYTQVLEIIHEGETKPTRIMYGANLSWNNFQDVLNSLMGRGLIEEKLIHEGRNEVKRYEITPIGVNVIQYFNRAKKLLIE
jgi:predicted transcriptional regulator